MTSGALAAGALTNQISAAESTSRWDDAGIAKYSNKLIDWLKANFAQRASTLATTTGQDFKLEYDYLAPTKEKSRLRIFEKYANADLSKKASDAHLRSCLAELEKIRQALAAAEAKAVGLWKSQEENAKLKEGKIYDSTVIASRLTVVLDCSYSMAPYLKAVREEIARDFINASIVEVNGCKMERVSDCPWFYSAPSIFVNPFTPDRHIPKVPTLDEQPYLAFLRWTLNTPAALECMVDLMKSDAIYWFCDFDDPTDDAIIKNLARKMLAQKTKLYIHTLDKRPPTLLVTLAEKSGGAVVRKRI